MCIRFFTGGFENPVDPMGMRKMCGANVPPDQQVTCSVDELCALSGNCVPRSSEVRYCMRTCDSDGDCRDGYECRDKTLMMEHGGEPVPQQGTTLPDNPQKFCAARP